MKEFKKRKTTVSISIEAKQLKMDIIAKHIVVDRWASSHLVASISSMYMRQRTPKAG